MRKLVALELTSDQHNILTQVVEKSIIRYRCDRRTIKLPADRRGEIIQLLGDIKQQLDKTYETTSPSLRRL